MSETLIKISKVLPKIFLGVFVALFVLQIFGFFFLYYFSAQAAK